jgi:hypothetical protein
VKLTLHVKVIQTAKELANDDGNVLFPEDAGFHLQGFNTPYIKQSEVCAPDRSTSRQSNICINKCSRLMCYTIIRLDSLHDDPEMRTLEIRSMVPSHGHVIYQPWKDVNGEDELGHMCRIQLGENLNLLLYVLYLILRALKIDDLDGDCLLCSFIVAA